MAFLYSGAALQELTELEEGTITLRMERELLHPPPEEENGDVTDQSNEDNDDVMDESNGSDDDENPRNNIDMALFVEVVLGRWWTEDDSFRIYDNICQEFTTAGALRGGLFAEIAQAIIHQEVENIIAEAGWTPMHSRPAELMFFEILHVVHDHIMELFRLAENLSSITQSWIDDSGSNGLSEETIERCFKTKNHNWRVGDEEVSDICVVCQDRLYQQQQESMIATLGCEHEYHVNCIKEWLRVKNSCPLCCAAALPMES